MGKGLTALAERVPSISLHLPLAQPHWNQETLRRSSAPLALPNIFQRTLLPAHKNPADSPPSRIHAPRPDKAHTCRSRRSSPWPPLFVPTEQVSPARRSPPVQ